MRDKSHDEQVERWAKFVKENPDKWKSKLKLFLDSQVMIARRFYKKLGKTKKGRKVIEKLKKENL
tara:strand:- start:178 stop:372 length:195 start_codon:yes stop_codon:yes gene_type:complete